MKSRGTPMPVGLSSEGSRGALSRGVGDQNVQKRGLSFGVVAGGNDVGRMDAVYSRVNLQAGKTVYDVGHSLRRVPGFVLLWRSENPRTPRSHYSVIPWERSKWSHSSIRIDVHTIVGDAAGGELVLMIGGE